MQIYQGSRCVTFTFKIFKQKLFFKSLISHSILQLAPFSPTDVICEKHISRENFWFHTCPRWDFWSQLFFSKFCWLVFDLWATSTAILRRSASFLFQQSLVSGWFQFLIRLRVSGKTNSPIPGCVTSQDAAPPASWLLVRLLVGIRVKVLPPQRVYDGLAGGCGVRCRGPRSGWWPNI